LAVVTRGKNDINTLRFLIDLHYMTDRQERFDLKIPKYCGNKDTNILDAPEVSYTYQKLISK